MKYFPEVITHKNYKHYMINNFRTHNTIVIFLSIIDGLLEMYQLYISSLPNNFDQFIEFVMRYCIYRNMILDL